MVSVPLMYTLRYIWGRTNERLKVVNDKEEMERIIKFMFLEFGMLPTSIKVEVKNEEHDQQ